MYFDCYANTHHKNNHRYYIMEKKIITVNPDLFKVSSRSKRKTKKRSKLDADMNNNDNDSISEMENSNNNEQKTNNIIKPFTLKQTLLNRIKERKKENLNNLITNDSDNEFIKSLAYINDIKQKQQTLQERKKTKKNYLSLVGSSSSTTEHVPESSELIPNYENTNENQIGGNNVFRQSINDVPYGCLKNGNKMSYKAWKRMTSDVIDTNYSDTRPPTPPKKREEDKLEEINDKLKKYEEQEALNEKMRIQQLQSQYGGLIKNSNLSLNQKGEIESLNPTKKIIKRTIRRKVTLGKQGNRVSVLIKNDQTRKNIFESAQKLKNTPMSNIRKYLKEHGMIKVGSTCPTEMLKDMFESAIMTGEVTNTNKDTLIHNFFNS